MRLGSLALAAVLATACRGQAEVVVFHAEALSAVLSDVAEDLQREAPSLRVRLEPGEASLAVRKLTELGLKADLVAVADAATLEALLASGKARWALQFASDEVVLAHKDHSRFTDEVSPQNWSEVIARPGVRLGCATRATSDLGARAPPAARCPPELTVPGEGELVGLLESRAADYVFLRRSTADSHHLKVTSTPGGDAPLACALTIPEGAANPDGAQRLIAALLSDRGRRSLERAGFHPLAPAQLSRPELVPAGVRALASRAP